jgi:hypothetical protein
MITPFAQTGGINDLDISPGISTGRTAASHEVRTDQLLVVKTQLGIGIPVPPEEPGSYKIFVCVQNVKETVDVGRRSGAMLLGRWR